MIFYLLGSFLYRGYWTSLGLCTAALIAILIYGLPQRFNLEFLGGIVIGLPIIIALMRFKSNRFDTSLGDASYGCFLNHGIAIWAFEHYLHITKFSFAQGSAVAAIACASGYASYLLVEKPTVPFRRRLRAGGP
jgi:peptidoglycan/LPS O-acetylase OafA/YrhL